MIRFGKARLYRLDIGFLRKMQYQIFGVGDPGHYLRSLYFRQFVEGLKPEVILDAGCGDGDYSFYLAERYPHAHIDAWDINESRIRLNKEIQGRIGFKNIQFRRDSITELNSENRYDLILCIDVLEHIANQEKVLLNFGRALKRNGKVFIHIPLERYRPPPLFKHLKDFRKWAEEEHVNDMLRKNDFHHLVAQSGLDILNSRPTFRYFSGEMAVSLFELFMAKRLIHRLIQGILLPVCRICCYIDLLHEGSKGFAVAVLAQKSW